MEIVYYNGFEIEAYYVGYDKGAKIFICQHQLVFANEDNEVQENISLISFIMQNINSINKLIDEAYKF